MDNNDTRCGLTPLPESEWPKWHEHWCETYPDRKRVYRIGDYFMVRYVEVVGRHWWAATNKDDTLWDGVARSGRPMWAPTPAEALEAAGLPVELLDGVGRKSGESSDPDPAAAQQPANENPRVVAAAVEMVKEVEQHKAKDALSNISQPVGAEYDGVQWLGQPLTTANALRTDWLAQFPEWVRDFTFEHSRGIPLRMLGSVALIHDRLGGDFKYKTFGVDGKSFESVKMCNRYVDMQQLAHTLVGAGYESNMDSVPLYADGNVPLWGDEVEEADAVPHRPSAYGTVDEICDTVIRLDGEDDVHYANRFRLLRRHPAIADLPGIRNDSSADRPDSNDSDSDATTSPPPAKEANKSTKVDDKHSGFVSSSETDKSTVVADKYGDSVGAKPSVTADNDRGKTPKLRVEQHKAKRAKDREEWLAQFPAWVRDWCADDDEIVPLRCGDKWLIYADAGTKSWHTSGYFGLHYREASPGKQFVGRLALLVAGLDIPLYAGGNVPLWGDEVEYESGNRYRITNITLFGAFVFDNGQAADSSRNAGKYRLLRRHPAIADLPGIRNDSSADRAGSNDSDGEVTTPPAQATEANKSTKVADKHSGFVSSSETDKSTVVADKYGDSVGAKPSVTTGNDRGNQPKLRVGMRVLTDSGLKNRDTGYVIGLDKVGVLVGHPDGCVMCWDANVLTPIPPPLIDNGDGTWTMEWYGMFVIKRFSLGSKFTPKFQWLLKKDHVRECGFEWRGSIEDTPAEAAADLWRRMEGIND